MRYPLRRLFYPTTEAAFDQVPMTATRQKEGALAEQLAAGGERQYAGAAGLPAGSPKGNEEQRRFWHIAQGNNENNYNKQFIDVAVAGQRGLCGLYLPAGLLALKSRSAPFQRTVEGGRRCCNPPRNQPMSSLMLKAALLLLKPSLFKFFNLFH